jgi:addiction module RelE/StbE family toxin
LKRLLLQSNTFIKAARRVVKKQPRITQDIKSTLALLSEDAFHPSLKTHKLKGKLEGSWACAAGFSLRIIFKIVQYEGSEAILLETIGTHEEVY